MCEFSLKYLVIPNILQPELELLKQSFYEGL